MTPQQDSLSGVSSVRNVLWTAVKGNSFTVTNFLNEYVMERPAVNRGFTRASPLQQNHGLGEVPVTRMCLATSGLLALGKLDTSPMRSRVS